jgi:hypothetical protein
MTWWWKYYIFTCYRNNSMVEVTYFTLYPNNLVIKIFLLVALRVQRWGYYFPHFTLRTWRWRYHTAQWYSSTGRVNKSRPSHTSGIFQMYILAYSADLVERKRQCKNGIKVICFAIVLEKYMKVIDRIWNSHSGTNKNSSLLECLVVPSGK